MIKKSFRQKLRFWLWVALAGMAFSILLTVILFLTRESGPYREFGKAHADAAARVEAMLAGHSTVGRATGGQPAPGPKPPTPTPPSSAPAGQSLKDDLTEIQNALNNIPEKERNNLRIRGGATEFSTILPDKTEPGGNGAPLVGNEALRRRIHEEILYRCLGLNILTSITATQASTPAPAKPNNTDALTTAATAAQNKIENFLERGTWAWPDFMTHQIWNEGNAYWALTGVAPGAAARMIRASDTGRAAALLAHYLDYMLALRVHDFPAPISFFDVRRLVLQTGAWAPDEALLEQIEARLRRGRWSAQQLDDLRAAHVLRLSEFWQMDPMSRWGSQDNAIQRALSTFGNRALSAFFVAMLRPTALAWGGGSAADYYQSLPNGNPLPSNLSSYGMETYPPELARANPDPPVNLELDLTRLAVAAARYKHVHGAYPRSLDDLIPDYLDESWRAPGRAGWVVDWLEPGIYPDRNRGTEVFRKAVEAYFVKNGAQPHSPEDLRPWVSDETEFKRFPQFFGRLATGQPVFYQVRWVTLPPECAPAARNDGFFLPRSVYCFVGAFTASPSDLEILKQLGTGQGNVEVLAVRGFLPQR